MAKRIEVCDTTRANVMGKVDPMRAGLSLTAFHYIRTYTILF